jgi:hypothetical protein
MLEKIKELGTKIEERLEAADCNDLVYGGIVAFVLLCTLCLVS